jgi:hypothetical protein
MALNPDNMMARVADPASGLRFRPYEDGIQPKTFKATAGAELLAPGTPVAQITATGLWVVWASAGIAGEDVIRGFVWPNEVQLHDSDTDDTEVIGNILARGVCHRDDIVLPAGELAADLDTALAGGDPSLRELGIHVQGLPGVG